MTTLSPLRECGCAPQELKRKYDTPQGAEGLAAARQKAEADLQALAAALGQRWGVSLTMDQGQSEALDAELNDVISSYAKVRKLEWSSSKQQHCLQG